MAKAKASPLALRLYTLFGGLHRAHGTYKVEQRKASDKKGSKLGGKALTERAPYTAELWDLHLRGTQGLGVVPVLEDGTCVWGCIDIDKYEGLSLEDLELQCARLGLPLLPTYSKSAGAHLYLFGKGHVPCELSRLRMAEWAVALGHGGCEVFPKQDKLADENDVGNWLNMPYFADIGEDGEPGHSSRYAIFNGKRLSVEEFIDRAAQVAVTVSQLEALSLPEGEEFAQGPPCLQSLARSGFPQGTRNKGLFAVGVYLKKRYGDDWLNYVTQYNEQFFKPPLPPDEVKTVVKSLDRKAWQYTCKDSPLKQVCNSTICRRQEFGVGDGNVEGSLGITVDVEVQRIMSDPPYYMLTINGKRVEIFCELITVQRSFQQVVFESVHVLPATLPQEDFRRLLNKWAAAAVEVEAPSDAGASGDLMFHLDQFCTVLPQAETREELLTGRPLTEDGWTHFRSSDFKRYLDSQHYRAITHTRLWATLRKLADVKARQLSVDGRQVGVWAIPERGHKVTEVPPRKPKATEGGM